MKRLIDYYLNKWKVDSLRKPLLLRGARQVGKTFAARTLGKSFDDFVEINFEQTPHIKSLFEQDLIPSRILRELTIHLRKPINPGKTLLFFDEIQSAPKAITALRYFYEEMPELHIIGAGSLLDFSIQEIGIPVGRVQSLYMFPVSFLEFLAATDNSLLLEALLTREPEEPLSQLIHEQILKLVAEYLALGGMPEVVNCWKQLKDPLKCTQAHSSLLDTYKQDFGKYAKDSQIKYVEQIFTDAPRQLGHKFKYSDVEGDYRKRELVPAVDLLVTAGILHKVSYSSCQGFPFGAHSDPTDYKLLFIDVGLAQAELNLELASWFVDPTASFVNKGNLVEAFVGQEMLAYSSPQRDKSLFYWRSKERGRQAEIDYVIQKDNAIIPVEVKAGLGSKLKSLHIFLESHKQSPYGIRFSAQNYSLHEKLHSYPLYSIANAIADPETLQAITQIIP